MRLIKRLVERSTRKNVDTFLHPRGKISGHIILSTVPGNYFNGYLIDWDKIKATESGKLRTSLPKKSNIRELDSQLDKISKEWGGWKGSAQKMHPGRSQLSWVDRFQRYMATRTETPSGISYILRADVANEVCQKGKLLVQCDEAFCDMLFPRKISLDAGRYSVASSTKNAGIEGDYTFSVNRSLPRPIKVNLDICELDNILIHNNRSPPEGASDKDTQDFLPFLEELVRTIDVSEPKTLIFGATGRRRQDARINAEKQIKRVLQLNPDEVHIREIEEFITFEQDPSDMECRGPVTRFQTVCWAPGTLFRVTRDFKDEDSAFNGMREMLKGYTQLATRTQSNPVKDPKTGKSITFPYPREIGFKCALNELESKKVCDLTPGKSIRGGSPQSVWQVEIENPLKD